MDKKEIYEHLAKIYLDASVKKKKKNKNHQKLIQNFFLLSFIIVVSGSVYLFSNLSKDKNLPSETALYLQNDVSKINFNFNPAKKEIFAINLNRLNVGRFKSLDFKVRKVNQSGNLALRVEFISSFKERSEVYVRNIPSKWQDYSLDLSSFKKISDWSEMSSLSFAIEEWNADERNGVVYIDDVRLKK